jgi:hypothetical protein
MQKLLIAGANTARLAKTQHQDDEESREKTKTFETNENKCIFNVFAFPNDIDFGVLYENPLFSVSKRAPSEKKKRRQ